MIESLYNSFFISSLLAVVSLKKINKYWALGELLKISDEYSGASHRHFDSNLLYGEKVHELDF